MKLSVTVQSGAVIRPRPEPSTTAGHRHMQEVGAAVSSASPRLLTSSLSLEAKLQVSDLIAAPAQVKSVLVF